MLEAVFQTRVPFLGKPRSPGDIVGGEELANVSRVVLDALVNQKTILLQEEGGVPGSHDPQVVSHLNARIDKLADQLAKESEARAADAKAATAQIEALKGALGEAVQAAVAKSLAAGADVEISRRREVGALAITDTTRVSKTRGA